jgi:hypothetical protein
MASGVNSMLFTPDYIAKTAKAVAKSIREGREKVVKPPPSGAGGSIDGEASGDVMMELGKKLRGMDLSGVAPGTSLPNGLGTYEGVEDGKAFIKRGNRVFEVDMNRDWE